MSNIFLYRSSIYMELTILRLVVAHFSSHRTSWWLFYDIYKTLSCPVPDKNLSACWIIYLQCFPHVTCSDVKVHPVRSIFASSLLGFFQKLCTSYLRINHPTLSVRKHSYTQHLCKLDLKSPIAWNSHQCYLFSVLTKLEKLFVFKLPSHLSCQSVSHGSYLPRISKCSSSSVLSLRCVKFPFVYSL